MNWRRRKREFKKTNGWMKRNGSNKSLHVGIRMKAIRKPMWNEGVRDAKGD